ncbi:exosome complex component RRP40-like [Mytilus trossulus]|uniref:exosome complex component RRP40-like n=1 Tax=Mytilus trossulus TaxID=6551 RepID=UPI00300772DF
MVDHAGHVYLPGELICNLKESEKTSKVLVGPGLRQDEESIIVTKCGLLRFKEPNFYWIDSHLKRYVAVKGDPIIGIVSAKAGDVFRLDIGSSDLATLSYLAFEGATKRNRPDVKVGDIVYAKCMVANKDMEPELVCIDSNGRSGGLGVIGRDGGFMFQTSLNLIRKLLSSDCVLLKTLGNGMHYECAIGMNGRVWVKAKSVSHTIALCNAISAAEYMSNEQIKAMCKKLTNALAGF